MPVPKKTVNKRQQKKNEQTWVVSNDMVRAFRPRSNKSKDNAVVVLNRDDLLRLKNELSGESSIKVRLEEDVKKARELAAAERVERIQKYASESLQQERVEDEEALEVKNSILAKAKRQMEEQEDEIKKMNEYILQAKCMAVREAQISEKEFIQRALKEEEARLDAIMEYNRVKGLEEVYQRAQKRKQELRAGAKIVINQIEARREAALLEAEKHDQEAKKFLENIQKQNELEIKKKEQLAVKRKELLNEILAANEESIHKKKQEKQRSKEEDKKILDYLVEKARKEEEKEKAEKLRKAEREKEFARLRAAQQKLADTRAEQDALRAKRASEEYEREWRRKEKEAAEKRLKQEEELKQSRKKQMMMKEHVMTVEAYKARQEFMEMVAKQKQIEQKLTSESQIKKEKARDFLVALKDQIHTKEVEKKKEIEDFLAEGHKFEQQRKERKQYIDDIIARKLNQLQLAGISETQCKEIERKMRLMEKMKISNQPGFVNAKASKADKGE